MRLALALVLTSSLAYAGANTKAIGKLSLTAPSDWKLAGKPLGITGESKDKEVALLAWPMDGTPDAPAVEKKLEGELYTAIANIKWDPPSNGKVHQLSAVYVSGTGHAKGGDIVVKSALVGPVGKSWILVACAVHVDKLEAHRTEIQSILDSVQASK